MINNQMDNPFAVGDLVHIPANVFLWCPDGFGGRSNEKPVIGMIVELGKLPDHYNVAVEEALYQISKFDICVLDSADKKGR